MAPRVSDSHKEQRRQHILDAAQRVFRAKGYGPTTMHDIVEEAGVSRGGVYLYFGSKEEVFMALLSRQQEAFLAEAAPGPRATQSCWQAVEQSLERLALSLETLRDDPDQAARVEFWSAGLRDERCLAFTRKRYEEAIVQMALQIRRGVEAREFRPLVPAEVIAKVMLSLTDGAHLHTLFLGPETTDPRGQVEAVRAFLRHALQVEEA